MRKILYVVIIAALFFVPLNRVNIADLEPVEAVALSVDRGRVWLQTDGGSVGSGITVEDALRDMKNRSSSVIYLDTAKYLLINENATAEADGLRPYLKGSVVVYVGEEIGDIPGLVAYLSIHGDLPKLCNWTPQKK